MSTLSDYLKRCRIQLRRRLVARGAAVISASALVATLVLAFVFVAWVPGSTWVIVLRVLLYAGLVAGIAALVWWPMDERAVARQVEDRVPEFGGRLQTWRDATERGDDTSMLSLLTLETRALAAAHDQARVVPIREVALPGGIAAVMVLTLGAVLLGGNGAWQLAAKRLWTGDLLTAAAPRITVSPGDTVVPRGADVVVEASASGFVVRRMEMNAAFENTDGWEQAPMSRLAQDKYGFVFVGVSEQVAYYVSAAGLNSERHVIHVADLPRVTDVKLAYHYPDWTGLPVSERSDGDVSALRGTEVAVTAYTDAVVEEPLLVVNGEVLEADADGFSLDGEFDVTEEGTWHVAVRHEGTLARISDSYFINVVEDEPPEVAFSFPGHDSQATPIEEVGLRFKSSDDYGIESLVLRYSVNGGSFVSVELDEEADEVENLLYLEDLDVPVDKVAVEPPGAEKLPFELERLPFEVPSGETAPFEIPPDERAPGESPVAESVQAGEVAQNRPLRPGDMISFYVQAADHSQEVRTALYFVDVRPYDKTYRESQQMAGSGGGGGGGLEIAERQREIVSATWNLINKQTDGDTDESVRDQAEVLAILQRTLEDQVNTVTERAQARRLDRDDEVDVFTRELARAAEFMGPAAEQLEARALEEAITPEQQALQHLLAAEASMTDVEVSMTRADMRGTAGRSLSELMDLEMDQERNRYEVPQSPGFDEGAEQDNSDWRTLEELAKRQQQLAEQQRNGEESLASKWQQERLQRELEKLREQLEQRQGRSGNRESLSNAISEVNRAREAIERSMTQPQGDPSSSRQASEALSRAAEQMREAERNELAERLARSGRQVQNLLEDQRTTMDRLEQLEQETLEKSRLGEADPLDNYVMQPYADRKRRMQEDLDDVIRDLGELGDTVADSSPETQRVLQRALNELTEERVDERLAATAEAFEFGRPLFASGNEATVERALERLADRVGQAQSALASSSLPENAAPIARVRALQQALADAASAEAAGAYDGDQVNGVLRATDALEFRLGQEMGEAFELDTTLSRSAYVERGTDEANTEAIVQMARDRLDLIESALLSLQAAPISAQEPRDTARDSEAAARYFRDLSAPPDG